MRAASRLSALLALYLVANPAFGEPVNFARDIQPIFETYCYECHGPGAAESGLRLNRHDKAFAPADSGEKPIVPGKVGESRLLKLVAGKDEGGLRMPPEDYGDALSAEEVALLERWVTEGAAWPADADVPDEAPSHWSFAKPVRPEVPQIANPPAENRNPIDAFVLARLQKEGMTPSAEADRFALARRVHLDLIGLPPTPEAVRAFVEDTSPDAYEKMVDRVLADPGYGERWARVWLDLARYADSKGYGSDPLRVIWRYRDWVIDAFNRNLPYDQFTIEQLAGDLLPHATPDQILATAFHRNTMANDEGGTDDEEFRVAAVKDRAETTMQVWMGLTLGCAKCHTHKFDPLTQREYYQFYAIFNQTEDADRADESPKLAVQTATELAAIEKLEKELSAAKHREVEARKNQPALSSPVGQFVRVQAIGSQRMVHLAEVQVFSGGGNVALKGSPTQSSTGFGGDVARAIDGNTNGDYSANSVTHTAIEDDPWWQVDLGKPLPIERVVLWNRTDGGLHTRLANSRVQLLDASRKVVWEIAIDNAPNPSSSFALIPQTPEAIEVARLEAALAIARRTSVPTPILRELPANNHRKTFVMIKGNFLSPGEEVLAAFPDAFAPEPNPTNPDRLATAQWLMSEENPLTARVTVNRFWSRIFGHGLVETEEDFGTQGLPPTHPELLDWLAIEFRDNLKWDVKQLLKLMVMSSTYRQSAVTSTESLARDPNNKFYGRGPANRLEAEMVRDQALAVSGLLSRKIGGPSVYPPQPDGLWRAAFNGERTWDTSKGEDRYRRGVYTVWRRTVPYPSMAAFDAPSREICTLRRLPTNTPLQAFVTLNDPVYVECAQALARRIVKESSADAATRAAFGLKLCLGRPAQPEQIKAIVDLVADELGHYRDDLAAAKQIATDPLGPVPEGLDAAELAAWTVASNVMLNLDGVLTKR